MGKIELKFIRRLFHMDRKMDEKDKPDKQPKRKERKNDEKTANREENQTAKNLCTNQKLNVNPRNPLNSVSQPQSHQKQANSTATYSESSAEAMDDSGAPDSPLNSMQESPAQNPVKMERVPSTSDLPVFSSQFVTQISSQSDPGPEKALLLATASAAFGHGGNAPYNWQATKICVKDRLSYLCNTEIMADVHFMVGAPPHQQKIPSHKFVLSVGSAVFDAQFNGPMATQEDIVEIPDVEPAAFISLLRFLYSDEVKICSDSVMTTLYAAKKYAVPALEKQCVEFLKRNLSSDNAFMLLTQARLFDEPQLAALCLETIDKNTHEALQADGFTDIDLETLCCVLERDTLGIREFKLFASVCRWAEAECTRKNLPPSPENQRGVLGRALRLIRFPLMSVEEFAQGAAQSGLLEDKEVVKLFLYFTVNPKPQIAFLDVPRCCLTGKEQVVSRFCQIESRWGYSGTSDRIRFMVNRRIFVVGFGLYGSIHGPKEYYVTIQIIQSDTGKVMGHNDTSFQCDGSNSTFRVMFKEPVEILPNTSYTACSTLKGPDSYYGAKGLRKVTHESVSSGKVTFQFTYAAGNNNGTSVEDGQIPEIIFYT
ncbi:BTB/POZ domain-containing protein 1-like isoform X1 [Mytilus trossulus]|uniref:BTB/POZ domain-containing protein 1-like isoform X1 n=2 Tax=Mytilus trossulus TaxID=6551 RepID=UPI003005615D